MGLDNKELQPATDEEIGKAIKEVLDEQEKEWDETGLFDETDEDRAFEAEWNKATTVKERTRVLRKYKRGIYRKGAEGTIIKF